MTRGLFVLAARPYVPTPRNPHRQVMTLRGSIIAAFGLLLAALAHPASAQGPLRIAAVVDNDVVTVADLEQRLNLVIASIQFEDTPDNRRRLRNQVLRQLIDDKLQLGEAKRLGITVSTEDIDVGFAELARRNNMSPDAFEAQLRQGGVEKEVLVNSIRVEIAWARVLQQRVRPQIRIGEDAINEALAKAEATRGQPEYLVSELVLAIDHRDQDEDASRNAQRLVEQLRAGANFAAMARQFSSGSTAPAGGQLGWLLEDQFPLEQAATVAAMKIGDISDPIRGQGGYTILTLRGKRAAMTADPLQGRVTLAQYVVPIARGGGAEAVAIAERRAREVAVSLSGCAALEARAKADDAPASGSLGSVVIAQLPDEVRVIALDLPVGQASLPLKADFGYRVLMVCERVPPPELAPPSRAGVEENLIQRRVALLAQRYMRHLRRSAFVEMR